MLAALAFWGYVVGDGVWAWLLGILAPVVAAIIWGTFVAPRAKLPVPAPLRVGIELVLYAAAAAGLGAAGQPLAAVVLGVAGLVTSLLNEVQERQAGS
jgi:predicted cation transporter